MSDVQDFVFSWRANRRRHIKIICAFTYAEACWKLGVMQAASFRVHGVPTDFKMLLNDEQARLGEPSAESTIEGATHAALLSTKDSQLSTSGGSK